MSTVCLTKLGIVIETTWLFGLCIVYCVCQPQNPPASTVLAPDIKSSPDDNSLGGGVRSPAILQGTKVDIGNLRTGEKNGKTVIGLKQKSVWPKFVKLQQKANFVDKI